MTTVTVSDKNNEVSVNDVTIRFQFDDSTGEPTSAYLWNHRYCNENPDFDSFGELEIEFFDWSFDESQIDAEAWGNGEDCNFDIELDDKELRNASMHWLDSFTQPSFDSEVHHRGAEMADAQEALKNGYGTQEQLDRAIANYDEAKAQAEAYNTLNQAMTTAEVELYFGLAKGTARQYLNRNTEELERAGYVRKSGNTWLILRSKAEDIWS